MITSSFPRSQVDIFVEVVNADGGILSASFNAVTLALMDAGIPMFDYLLSCSSSYVQGNCLVDPNRMEETANGPVVVAALLARSKRCVFLNSEMRLPSDKLPILLDSIKHGVSNLFSYLDSTVVKPYLNDLLEMRRIK